MASPGPYSTAVQTIKGPCPIEIKGSIQEILVVLQQLDDRIASLENP
jgi:hypothetical protein